MNMPAFNLENIHSIIDSINTQNDGRWKSAFALFENEQAVFQLLDAKFPLHEGSHKDVKQYVVYFRHLMVFFEDGTHCGLENTKQFVAYAGKKEFPDSILLQDNDNHLEIVLDKNGARSLSNISDVLIEFPFKREFTTPDGQLYLV